MTERKRSQLKSSEVLWISCGERARAGQTSLLSEKNTVS